MGEGDYGDNWERTFGRKDAAGNVNGVGPRGDELETPLEHAARVATEPDPEITVTVDGGSKYARTVEFSTFKTVEDLLRWVREDIERRVP